MVERVLAQNKLDEKAIQSEDGSSEEEFKSIK